VKRITPIIFCVGLALSRGAGLAQTAAPATQFEVAWIKPGGTGHADPPGLHVSGGTCHGIDSHFPEGDAIIAPPPLGRCVYSRITLGYLLSQAYRSNDVVRKVKGLPAWANTETFDIEAKAEDPSKATGGQLLEMMQQFLTEQFKLQIHTEPGEAQGFALLVAKGGAKLKPAEGPYSGLRGNGLMVTAKNAQLAELPRRLESVAGGPVVHETGLVGNYSFTLPIHDVSIFTVLKEQLGLRLESKRVKVDFVVVDHAEKPAPQ